MVALICTITLMCELNGGGQDEQANSNSNYHRWFASLLTQPPEQLINDPIISYEFSAQLAFYEWNRERLPFQDQMVMATGAFYFDPDAAMTLMIRPDPIVPYAFPFLLSLILFYFDNVFNCSFYLSNIYF